jgi:mono/diheme cytochrome c family protein
MQSRVAVLALACATAAGVAAPYDSRATAPRAAVERGRYLVHDVAMCIYCHTPKDEGDGSLVAHELLAGAPIPFASPYPQRAWSFRAPRIAGLPGGWSEADLVRLLRTGRTPSGREPAAPMPPFRMSEEDARAVAAYLRSLESLPE